MQHRLNWTRLLQICHSKQDLGTQRACCFNQANVNAGAPYQHQALKLIISSRIFSFVSKLYLPVPLQLYFLVYTVTNSSISPKTEGFLPFVLKIYPQAALNPHPLLSSVLPSIFCPQTVLNLSLCLYLPSRLFHPLQQWGTPITRTHSMLVLTHEPISAGSPVL